MGWNGTTYFIGTNRMNSELIKIFAKNRAEEFPIDVWGEYVLPPNYQSINLFNFDKAVMVEGGRGSGKTMFLRYHCHDTRFSSKRENIAVREVRKIGLYLRPDTHFCSSITQEIYGSSWKKIFSKYILINVLREFSSVVKNISQCSFEKSNFPSERIINLELPRNFNDRMKTNLTYVSELGTLSDELLAELNDWVSDPDYFKKPVFPDTRSILKSVIDNFRKFSEHTSSTSFTLYIDEYENLTTEQQNLINDWIKHGADDLIISSAYKKHANVSRNTSGEESLVLRNDYRKIDLEDFSTNEFKIFAAEILILKLKGCVEESFIHEYRKLLCDESLIDHRLDEKYSENLLAFANNFLPSISYEDVAKGVFQDKTLEKRLRDFLIKPALRSNELTPEIFIDSRFPVESILNGVLLNRPSQSENYVLDKFKELRKNGDNTFYKSYTDVLVGAILWIYISAGRRTIPIYSGFDRICLMARSNLRHFLEFCHQCLVEYKRSNELLEAAIPSIPVSIQALAARKNSELEVAKVVELGRWGNNLRFIVNRLGLFFQLLQKRKSQSEPEIVHFGIEVTSVEMLPENIKLLLSELKVWSVLIEYQGDTKRKSHLDFTSYEYMLHPMFSPNFSISFRKIRKHTFSVKDIEIIFCGSEDDFINFCKPYLNKSVSESDFSSAREMQGTLFDEI